MRLHIEGKVAGLSWPQTITACDKKMGILFMERESFGARYRLIGTQVIKRPKVPVDK